MSAIENGVDQLIGRIRVEAMQKVELERERIIAEAKREAEALIAQAKEDALRLSEAAKEEIKRERETLKVELELAARDFCVSLHERLRTQMFFPLMKETVRATVKEPDFLKEVLMRLINTFVTENPCNLDVLVPKELKTTLAAFFASTIFEALEQNCDIRLKDEDGLEGFVLIRRGEHFVWDFRVDTIALELMRLVEPSLRKYFLASSHKSASNSALSALA